MLCLHGSNAEGTSCQLFWDGEQILYMGWHHTIKVTMLFAKLTVVFGTTPDAIIIITLLIITVSIMIIMMVKTGTLVDTHLDCMLSDPRGSNRV